MEYFFASLAAVAEKKFQIVKPWTSCLVENKRSWKEQAVKGKNNNAHYTFPGKSISSYNASSPSYRRRRAEEKK